MADSATNTRGDEIAHSDNSDISPNEIPRGNERLAEEANQRDMTKKPQNDRYKRANASSISATRNS